METFWVTSNPLFFLRVDYNITALQSMSFDNMLGIS